MPRLQQNGFKTRSGQPRMQPLRQWPCLKSNLLHRKAERPEEGNQRFGLAGNLCFLHNLTLRIHNANARQFQ